MTQSTQALSTPTFFRVYIPLAMLIALFCFPNCSGPECAEDGDCVFGQRCSSGACISNSCTGDDDCLRSQTCQDGQCKEGTQSKDECTQDSDCKAPTPKCDANQKKCVGCLNSDDCRSDQDCTNNQCKEKEQPECTSDADCRSKANPRCSGDGKCEWECTSDTDCTKGTCQEHKCVVKPECTKDSDCQGTKSVCENNKCVSKAECSTDADCQGQAKPMCSSAGKCEWECRVTSDCKGSSCVDNTCATANKPCVSPNDCAQGETCFLGVCAKACNPTQDTCEAGKGCFDANSPTSGFCLKQCNPQDGRTACGDALLCVKRFDTSTKTYCLPPHGPRQQGQSCNIQDPNQFCMASQYLACFSPQIPGGSFSCLKGCNPAKGTSNNPDCKGGRCTPYPLSHWGGACIPQSTEPEGSPCPGGKACPTGQTCSQINFRCYKSCATNADCGAGRCIIGTCAYQCDPAQGRYTNSKCKLGQECREGQNNLPSYCLTLSSPYRQGPRQLDESCSTSEKSPNEHCDGSKNLFCGISPKGGLACQQGCDPRKGFVSNPDCGGASCNIYRSPFDGICSPIGTKKAGETCDLGANACEKGLSCLYGVCSKSCHPEKTASGCSSDEICQITESATGCSKKCDPKQGLYPNTTCGAGSFCNLVWDNLTSSTCQPLPTAPSGTKQEGDACNPSTDLCDGSKGLVCSSLDSVCVKACDPQKGSLPNVDCPTDHTCRVNPSGSYKGGYCIQYRTYTRKKGESCLTGTDKSKPEWNKCEVGLGCSTNKTCVDGKAEHTLCGTSISTYCSSEFYCVGIKSVNRFYCKKPCWLNNPTCGPGLTCLPYATHQGDGICFQSCQTSNDCTKEGKECTVVSGKQVCR
ncbi:MAG: hypothetical protein CL920_00935 [Deltaproteobacteria bacterium]|nr:hypothetical protein [Deltaproteobacteria bacterium]MBU47244.1 hypothetical protein [Deltaproteobacteria bacterium]